MDIEIRDIDRRDYPQIQKWWDWPAEKIFENPGVLCSADLGRIWAL